LSSKKSEDEKNVEDRKHNIIIYKIPERKTENLAERNSNDAVFVRDLCDCVFDMKVEAADIEKMYRLGRWVEGQSRPLLVAFKNYEMKEEIMTNLRKLKHSVEKFIGIGISHDLHPQEREDRKRMIQEAIAEHDNLGGDGSVLDTFVVISLFDTFNMAQEQLDSLEFDIMLEELLREELLQDQFVSSTGMSF